MQNWDLVGDIVNHREDPTSATAAVLNRMDPQSNSSSYNGGYKPQARKRQGGG